MMGGAFAPSDAVYSSPKRSGRLKSAWTVEHCHSLLGLGLGLGAEHCHSLYYVGWGRRTLSWVNVLTYYSSSDLLTNVLTYRPMASLILMSIFGP